MAKKPGKARKTTAYLRLRGLGPERMSTIEYRLLRGDGPTAVARLIQDEWKEYTDVKEATLIKQLVRYTESELANQMALHKDEPDSEKRQELITKLDEQLSVVDEMAALVKVQKDRLEKGLKFEKKMPTLSSHVNTEVRLLKDTLKDLAHVQLETGILHRASHKVDARVTHESAEQGYRRLEMEQEEQEQVSQATDKALRELGLLGGIDTEDAEDAEWSEFDGTNKDKE